MRNLFWFIGGSKIVPSSKIIGAYIRRIDYLISQTRREAGLAVNYTYNGPTYKTYIEDKKTVMPTLDQIAAQIYMKITINLHMPSLLSDI
jgi:hypothetical protein